MQVRSCVFLSLIVCKSTRALSNYLFVSLIFLLPLPHANGTIVKYHGQQTNLPLNLEDDLSPLAGAETEPLHNQPGPHFFPPAHFDESRFLSHTSPLQLSNLASVPAHEDVRQFLISLGFDDIAFAVPPKPNFETTQLQKFRLILNSYFSQFGEYTDPQTLETSASLPIDPMSESELDLWLEKQNSTDMLQSVSSNQSPEIQYWLEGNRWAIFYLDHSFGNTVFAEDVTNTNKNEISGDNNTNKNVNLYNEDFNNAENTNSTKVDKKNYRLISTLTITELVIEIALRIVVHPVFYLSTIFIILVLFAWKILNFNSRSH